jgi:hypothetical protein
VAVRFEQLGHTEDHGGVEGEMQIKETPRHCKNAVVVSNLPGDNDEDGGSHIIPVEESRDSN